MVIDNTNATKKDRALYAKLALDKKIKVRCFKMNVDMVHAQHNNKVYFYLLILLYCYKIIILLLRFMTAG